MVGELMEQAQRAKNYPGEGSTAPREVGLFCSTQPNRFLPTFPEKSCRSGNRATNADAGIIVATTDFGDLRTLPFADDRLVVVVAPGHPLARRRELAFRDLGQFEFIELSSGRALAAFLARQAARAGQTLKVRVRMTSFEAVCQMVQLGAGIAIVPERAARKHRRSMMRVINLTDDWAQRRLLICCRQQDELSDHAKRLVKHLKAPQPA